MAGEFLRQLEHGELLAVFANGNFLARAHLVRRNINLAVVDCNVPVPHQLPRLAPRLCEAKTEHNVVKTPLQLLQQQFTRYALGASSLLKIVAELPFLREVDALRLLLFTQLQTVAHDLGFAVFPMLSRSEVALLDGTLIAKTLCAFEKQLHPLAAA